MNAYKFGSRVLLAASMVAAGTLHLAIPNFFLQIMPPYLPYHAELVAISGIFEILGGIGLLVPQTSRFSAWGLIALFIAVFPANVNMAVNKVVIEGIPYDPLAYWLRLPFQGVLIALAYWFTKGPSFAEEVVTAAQWSPWKRVVSKQEES